MTTKELFYSIIVPTFNRAELIHDTVTSILNQRNIDFELIIVDDGSTDNTFELIQGFNDDRINYVKTTNRERGAARNTGLRVARGAYINFFDSDDLLNPCLLELSKVISENNFPKVIYGRIENVSEGGKSVALVRPTYSNFDDSILFNNFLACGSVFIRRDIALKYSFSEDVKLSGTEDWELWLRLYSENDFMPCDIVIFRQRMHSSRSLHQVPAYKVVERENAFIHHINMYKSLLQRRFSKSKLDLLIADRYTLMALFLVDGGSRIKAFQSLKKSMLVSIPVLQRRRFWAVLKKLILR